MLQQQQTIIAGVILLLHICNKIVGTYAKYCRFCIHVVIPDIEIQSASLPGDAMWLAATILSHELNIF